VTDRAFRPDLVGRCGTCARFVRVTERVDANGEVKRVGECLLGVWSPPLFETNTCSQYVQRGTVSLTQVRSGPRAGGRRATAPSTSPSRGGEAERRGVFRVGRDRDGLSRSPPVSLPLQLPEDLLSMDADEFRSVLREVIREEFGAGEAELGARWDGGELILKPGKDGTQEKRVPLDAFFNKVVMVRDRLRVLEQKINGHPKLSAEEKVTLQQYVTQCYGSLTTFNVLFANRADWFVGQKGDKDGERDDGKDGD
jgi:hypothetical protein